MGDLEQLPRYGDYPYHDGGRISGFLGSNISDFRENKVLEVFHQSMTERDVLLLEVDWIGGRSHEQILDGYSDEVNKAFVWQPLAFLGIKKSSDWSSRFSFRMSDQFTDVPSAASVVSEYAH